MVKLGKSTPMRIDGELLRRVYDTLEKAYPYFYRYLMSARS